MCQCVSIAKHLASNCLGVADLIAKWHLPQTTFVGCDLLGRLIHTPDAEKSNTNQPTTCHPPKNVIKPKSLVPQLQREITHITYEG